MELALFEVEEVEVGAEEIEVEVEVWAEAVFWSVQQGWLVLRIAESTAERLAALAVVALKLAAVKALEPVA